MDEPEHGGSREPAAAGTSRRRFLVAGTLGAAGLMGGTAAAVAAGRAAEAAPPDTSVIPFYGKHQAGIATSVQDRLAFAAFDLTTSDARAAQTMLGTWAAAAARMTQGLPIGAV